MKQKLIIGVVLLICGAGGYWQVQQQNLAPVQQTLQYMKHGDLAYGTQAKQKLDVYTPTKQTERMPVVIHLHGGGWSGGSKTNVGAKPALFTDRGYIFISANYRLHPEASYEEMAQDTAAVLKWVYEHADEYGMDRTRINLMGHSAGGHLAGLVGTNPLYVQQAGLPADIVRSLVILDGPLDLAPFVQMLDKYKNVFGNDAAVWKQASPMTYMKQGHVPPTLIVTRRYNPTYLELAQTAKSRGDNVLVYDKSKSLSHSEVNSLLGDPDAPAEAKQMTDTVMQFLQQYNG